MLKIGQPIPSWASAPIACPFIDGRHGAILRAWLPIDVPTVLNAGTDAGITDMFPVPTDGSTLTALSYMSKMSSRMILGSALAFAIADVDNTAVGYLGVGLGSLWQGRIIVGYWVAPKYRGHGFQTRALNTLVEWSEQVGSVSRVEAHIDPHNAASIRTAEKAGFLYEATLRNWEIANGVPKPMSIYARLSTPHHPN